MLGESKFRQATPKYAALQQSSVFLETEPKSCEVEHAGEIRARSDHWDDFVLNITGHVASEYPLLAGAAK